MKVAETVFREMNHKHKKKKKWKIKAEIEFIHVYNRKDSSTPTY